MIQRSPPPEGAYRFVVMNTQAHAEGHDVYPMEVISYAETKLSRCIAAPWLDGRKVHLIFWNTKPAFDRSLALGWQDVTQKWMDHVESERVGPTTESQKAILDSLNTAWQSKSDIMKHSNISDTEWRTAIKTLLERGLAQKSGKTNRTYKYRLAV